MKYKATHGLKGRVNNPGGRTKEYEKVQLCIQVPSARLEQIKRIIKKLKAFEKQEWIKRNK